MGANECTLQSQFSQAKAAGVPSTPCAAPGGANSISPCMGVSSTQKPKCLQLQPAVLLFSKLDPCGTSMGAKGCADTAPAQRCPFPPYISRPALLHAKCRTGRKDTAHTIALHGKTPRGNFCSWQCSATWMQVHLIFSHFLLLFPHPI